MKKRENRVVEIEISQKWLSKQKEKEKKWDKEDNVS